MVNISIFIVILLTECNGLGFSKFSYGAIKEPIDYTRVGEGVVLGVGGEKQTLIMDDAGRLRTKNISLQAGGI